MAENLCTGHELIIKVYDEEGGELLYSGGFVTEPNDTVEDFLLENSVTLSNVATAELECDMTGDLWAITGTWKTQTFYEILSSISLFWRCDPEGEDVEGNATEVPATLVMSVYGALNKGNNQHGAIFTWHSVPYDDYSAMRGPCPEGFHIMTEAEGNNLINAFTGLGLSGSASFRQYFKVPITGVIIGTTGQIGQSTTMANFRLSEMFTTTGKPRIFTASKYYALACGGTTIDGCSIRPYKDAPVAPDNSWTTLYDGSSTSTGAGIFHNSTLGLISISSDGTNWITVADKNLGATVVYNEGDAVSETNAGKLYQRGNNHGFPLTGATTTSSTRVNTTGYGPGNYYTSSTFITVSNDNEFWTDPSNPNLRGGVTGVQSGYKLLHKEFYTDYSAMRGPCPEGFHVPLDTERQAVYNIWTALGGGASAGNDFLNALKMPKIGHLINQNGTVVDRDNYGDYWSSAPSYTTTVNNASFYMHAYNNNSINPQSSLVRPNGMCLRAFKDEPVVPNSTRTMLYGTSLASGGIFWDQTAGLISMSSDGITWITIRDKNEGATSVYNNGDTKTAVNCGGYYQRGNNHLFPFGSEVTTGTELVDTTGYGPGNYYSGATFIVTNTSPNDWSSVRNDNLRGGVTGAVEKGRRVI